MLEDPQEFEEKIWAVVGWNAGCVMVYAPVRKVEVLSFLALPGVVIGSGYVARNRGCIRDRKAMRAVPVPHAFMLVMLIECVLPGLRGLYSLPEPTTAYSQPKCTCMHIDNI
jgi:hypothetical protein